MGNAGEMTIPPSQIKDCNGDGMIQWHELQNPICFEQLQKAGKIYDPRLIKHFKNTYYGDEYLAVCAVDVRDLPEDPYANDWCKWMYMYDYNMWETEVSN